MTYVTEFHVHTSYSHDSNIGKFAMLAMCKLRGVDCIAITDHNEIAGAIGFRPWLKRRGIDVIVGEEIFTNEGELIGLFLKERIEPGLSPDETISSIKKQNGVVYIPHPYDEKRRDSVLASSALKRCANQVTCAEIHNGRNIHPDYSARQQRIAEGFGLLPIVGGDSHCFFELGRNLCITDGPFEQETFVETLLTARFKTKPCLNIAHKITRFVRLRKMIAEGDFDALYRVLYRKLARR